MWFAFALLIFSTIFALAVPALPATIRRALRLKPLLLVGSAVSIGIVSFLVRIVQPQGTAIGNFQLCYFAQYIAAFPLGVLVSRQNWLESIAEHQISRKAGWLAINLCPIGLLGILFASLPVPADGNLALNRCWNPMAFTFAVWEQLTGLGLGLGLISFCRRSWNTKTAFSAWLSHRSFSVYFLHAPVLIMISLWVQPIRTSPFIMAPAITLLALVGTFLVADLALRIPLLRSVL